MKIMTVLITGARGFVGRNLCTVLKRQEGLCLIEIDVEQTQQELAEALGKADVIFHLAGVNRPQDVEEFSIGNTVLTGQICDMLLRHNRTPKIIFTSSIQAELDNPYGKSKREAEEVLRRFANDAGAECVVYRMKNLFGKWCRPNYNAVTATFCHNIAHDLPIQISDPSNVVELTYIDDVISAFVGEIDNGKPSFRFAPTLPFTRITLGEIAEKIKGFHKLRSSLRLPDLSGTFDRTLYGTYLSYLDDETFCYDLERKSDQRGSLAEFLKAPTMGQIFISRTIPGVTRGNHYHHTKAEKFLVVEGEAVIRFRHIERDEVIEYRVNGNDYRVLDIPPGYTHSIENVGQGVLVTIFWASELLNPEKPDTYFEKVMRN
jgi:UDP-2-acetamido-2,6-beta-L-arabino-hexul-4-ose reductase